MRVMVLGLRGFPGVQGGVETHAEHLYPLLARMGCTVDVIVRSPYVPATQKTWQGINFHRLWAPRLTGVEAMLHSVLGVLYAAFRRPDILHIHAIGPAIVTPLARLLGLRVVVTHHGPDYDREKWSAGARCLLRLGERWGMTYAQRRIVISRVIHDLVMEKYRQDSAVIPNGVILHDPPAGTGTLQQLGAEAGHYVLLVGRYVPEKRHLDLINAYRRAGLRDWKLVLVGAVEASSRYCQEVLSLAEKTPGVIVAGFQGGTALRELYAHAGVFVLPSSHEGLPIALLEAMSYGTPVIASDIPAHLEIGLAPDQYFPLGDTARLAELIERGAAGNLRSHSRSELRDWVRQRYDWSRIAQQTLAVYQSVVNGEHR